MDQPQILHVTLEVRRHPGYYIFNIVIPMFMLVLMSAGSWVIPAEQIADRLSASFTLVLTAVAYKYNVVQTVPPIGHLTWLDAYNIMCYVFLFLVVVENCLAFEYQDVKFYGGSIDFHAKRILGALFASANLVFGIFACCARGWPSRIVQRKLGRKRSELPKWTDGMLSPTGSMSCFGGTSDRDQSVSGEPAP